MKELSIEEKALAYDEIVARAKKYLEDCPDRVDARGCIEHLIPELAESEDERIRKALIKLVKKAGEGYENVIDGVSIENAISWLEKQGEQKPVKEKFKHPLYVEGFEAGKQVGAQYESVFGKKQKTVEHLELKAGHWYICHRAYCCRADHLTVKEGERFMCEKDGVVKGFVIKNPENYFKEVNASAPLKDEYNLLWSEEDESNRITIVGKLLNSQINAKPYEYATYGKLISWVNYLKDRILSQPKHEWSEEDIERMVAKRAQASGTLKNEIDFYRQGIEDTLKSLRHQKQWKPSKEQIKAFEYCIENNCCDKDGINGSKMVELYKQLKAL